MTHDQYKNGIACLKGMAPKAADFLLNREVAEISFDDEFEADRLFAMVRSFDVTKVSKTLTPGAPGAVLQEYLDMGRVPAPDIWTVRIEF